MSIKHWIGRVLLYLPLVVGMAAIGLAMLHWFLSPPNPDRVGDWFFILLFGLPFLGVVGVIILGVTRSLRVSGTLLVYVVLAWGSGFLGSVLGGLFSVVSYEWFQALLYIGASIWLIIIALRWLGSRLSTARVT